MERTITGLALPEKKSCVLFSSPRKEDLLMDPEELRRMYILRKVLSDMNPAEAMELLINRMSRSKTNSEFLMSMNLS